MEVQTTVYQLLAILPPIILIDSFWLVGTPFVIAFFFVDLNQENR